MKLVDKMLDTATAAAEEIAARKQRYREEQHQAELLKIRRERAERQRALQEKREQEERVAAEAAAARPSSVQRQINNGVPESPRRLPWTDERVRAAQREGEDLERERTARLEARRRADLDRQQAALEAWAARREELRAKVREAERTMQQARGEMDNALGAGDAEAAGSAKQRLDGAQLMHDAAKAELERHRCSQPSVIPRRLSTMGVGR